MTRLLPLALVQAPAETLSAFVSGLERRVKAHAVADLFVYPELHLCTAAPGTADYQAFMEETAEPLDGPRGRALGELAGDLGVWLAPGSVLERGADGLIYNTSLVYSPQGELVASYRKIFPWKPYETVASGTEFVVFDMTGYGRVGLSICYDAWFPEHSRHLAWMGAEIVLNVVQTPTSDRQQEVAIGKANAIVNQNFVASVNAAGPTGAGRSLLIDPEGRTRISAAGPEDATLVDVIDLDQVKNVRQYGTAGVTKPWEQFTDADAAVPLPLYSGRLDPNLWQQTTGSSPDTLNSARA
ncbi:carbon-nitrogen hydrolase family protein [Arthrobacter woluwensis]|uniref:carbon-nitrogen hydrolase family protein n=1 Tax=Arthrobacter woluwensis TaxID=156980 RepID=UPI000D120583|nr:carbon-nitrogen hydrolase family protein [Arthrobacter woluwensis]PSS43148.1 carbon-nitrogen hydrolase family protein [Arthrobacter woluwensis]